MTLTKIRWKQLAAHYQNHSGDLFFELLNEPNSLLTEGIWNQYLQEAIVIIRQTEAANWGAARDRPLNVGEFGAYSKADMPSRALWTEFVARTAEANGMSWHYWEFIAGFGVYNSVANDWNYPLLNALIPKASQVLTIASSPPN